jgi:hypothetical protein
MKSAFLIVAFFLGCAGCSSGSYAPGSITEISVVVRQLSTEISLSAPRDEVKYCTEFDIVAPRIYEGRRLSVSSKVPLAAEHILLRGGTRLRLKIRSLEKHRGTSLVPAEGITRIEYFLDTSSFQIMSEEQPNQAPEPTIPGVTPRAEDKPRVAPPGVVAQL